MNNKYEIWPFLIGRSYDKDYRVIVTPDFISRSGNTSLLSMATGEINLTDNNDLVSRQVYSENFEPFTILFQVKKVQESYIRFKKEESFRDYSDNKFLVDEHGREIYLVEGIVVKASTLQDDFQISEEFFQKIELDLMDLFKGFWEGNITTKSIGSRNLPIFQESGLSKYLNIKQIEPFGQIHPILPKNKTKNKNKSHSKKDLYIALLIIGIILLILTIETMGWELKQKQETIENIEQKLKQQEGFIEKLKAEQKKLKEKPNNSTESGKASTKPNPNAPN